MSRVPILEILASLFSDRFFPRYRASRSWTGLPPREIDRQKQKETKTGRQIPTLSRRRSGETESGRSYLVARVGVERGEVRERDDRGYGDDHQQHGVEHRARSVVRPSRVPRQETRAFRGRVRDFSCFSLVIFLFRPSLAARRGGRRRHDAGKAEMRETSATCYAACPGIDEPVGRPRRYGGSPPPVVERDKLVPNLTGATDTDRVLFFSVRRTFGVSQPPDVPNTRFLPEVPKEPTWNHRFSFLGHNNSMINSRNANNRTLTTFPAGYGVNMQDAGLQHAALSFV